MARHACGVAHRGRVALSPLAKRARRAAAAPDAAPAGAAVPDDDVGEFLRHLEKERDVSPNTVTAYRRDLDELVTFLARYYGGGAWSWQGVDRLALRGFLAHLQRRGLGKRSIGRALSAARRFEAAGTTMEPEFPSRFPSPLPPTSPPTC